MGFGDGSSIMGMWHVKDEADRDRWTFVPLIGVGPLRFGMSHKAVTAALGSQATIAFGDPRHGGCLEARFPDLGVATYFTRHTELACVAIDARTGPQVTLDGTALVGRVPSELDRWMFDRAAADDADLTYTHEGNPGLPDLGLFARAQRAGDAVLSRPLFMIHEWTDVTWDHVPASEWNTF